MNLWSSPHCGEGEDRLIQYEGCGDSWAHLLPDRPAHVLSDEDARPLQHVGPVEDGLLVVVVLEGDHQGGPAADLGVPGAGVTSDLVGVSRKMLTSMTSLRTPSLVRTMSAMMFARDSMHSPGPGVTLAGETHPLAPATRGSKYCSSCPLSSPPPRHPSQILCSRYP